MAREKTELAATEAIDLLDKKDGIISQLQDSIEKKETTSLLQTYKVKLNVKKPSSLPNLWRLVASQRKRL